MLWSILSGIFGATASSMIKLATSSSSSSMIGNGTFSNAATTATATATAAETALQPLSLQPFQYVSKYVCEPRPWLVDLDETLLRGIYRFLGDLATGKNRLNLNVNLTMYFKAVRTTVEQKIYPTIFPYLFEVDYCQCTVIVPLRVCCIVAMVVLNAYMIASFLRGIQESGSVVGTALSTASNFITSVILGSVVWNEHKHLTTTWYVGFSCVLLGVMLLSNVQQQQQQQPTTTSTTKSGNDSLRRNGPLVSNKKSTTKENKDDIPRPKVSVRETVQSMNMGRTSTINNNNNNNRMSENVSSTKQQPQNDQTTTTTTFMAAKSTTTEIPSMMKKTTKSKKSKKDLKPVSSLEQYYNESTRKGLNMTTASTARPLQTPLIERGFLNECILCEHQLFDTKTGHVVDDDLAVADLSCSHVVHSSCLKQAAKSLNNSCPICNQPLSMFTSTKQAASCSGFWIQRIEDFLMSLDGPPTSSKNNNTNNNMAPQCLPASIIRQYFKELPDSVLTISQKQYIEDDPSGMDKGFQSALEWGGCRDYNNYSNINDSSMAAPRQQQQQQRGRLGYEESLRSQGIWRYDRKKDDVWFWGWGNVHPRQRCDQCQHIHGTALSIHCDGCQGSSMSAHYCSEVCEKRDRQRHKVTCQKWKSLNLPVSG